MPEKDWGDLPGHDVGDASNRFERDEFRARLFGGPAASLYGDTGIPAQGGWDSKEIPAVSAENSGAASVQHRRQLEQQCRPVQRPHARPHG